MKNLLDGLTTGGMTLVVLHRRDVWYLMIHCLYWIASCMYHVTASQTWLWCNLMMIRYVTAEKMYTLHPMIGKGSFVLSLVSLFIDSIDTLDLTLYIVVFLSSVQLMILHDVYLTLFMILTGITWCAYRRLQQKGYHPLVQFMVIQTYHLILWAHDNRMSRFWVTTQDEKITWILRFAMMFGVVFHFLRKQYTPPPQRLKSVLTFMVSIPLAVVGMYGSCLFFSDYSTWKNTNMSERPVDLFYAYVMMDMICAVLYYRREFSLLEGWIHHLCATGLFFYLDQHKLYNAINTVFLVDTPTILLSLNRILRTPRTLYLYGKIFPWLFVVCRIIVFNLLVYFWETHSSISIIASSGFTVLNTYWFVKMRRHTHSNTRLIKN